MKKARNILLIAVLSVTAGLITPTMAQDNRGADYANNDNDRRGPGPGLGLLGLLGLVGLIGLRKRKNEVNTSMR